MMGIRLIRIQVFNLGMNTRIIQVDLPVPTQRDLSLPFFRLAERKSEKGLMNNYHRQWMK